MNFDEKDLENIIMKALEGPPKAPATPTLLDSLLRRRERRALLFERGFTPFERPERLIQPTGPPLIQFKPKEIKAPKVRRRSKRYPFLEIEV